MQRVGDDLVGKLPDHPRHPKGRNAHAHVAERVLSSFGCSYKDLPDEKFGELMGFVSRLHRIEIIKWRHRCAS